MSPRSLKDTHHFLTCTDLYRLPEWLERLYHDSKVLDDDLILELMKETRESHSLLADKLTDLVDNFQIKKIQEIIKSMSPTDVD